VIRRPAILGPMFQARRSLPPLCLALIMGLTLAWPDLAHRRLHEQSDHAHEHLGHRSGPTVSGDIMSSESHHGDHPHLDVIAIAPAKAVLHLASLVVERPASIDLAMGVVRVSQHAIGSNRPRSPPAQPATGIRAPPSA
jgi:hypothetical protein